MILFVGLQTKFRAIVVFNICYVSQLLRACLTEFLKKHLLIHFSFLVKLGWNSKEGALYEFLRK